MQSRPEWPRLFRPSNAMPPVIEPSPMTATMRRSCPGCDGLGRREPVGVAQHGRGVAVLDPVVLGLGPRRVAGHAARLAQRREAVGAAGDDLVDVGLVAGVPQDDVVGRVEHPVQGQGELDDAEVGAEVAAALRRHRIDDQLAHLLGQDLELLGVERLEVGRRVDRLEDHEAAASLPVRGEGGESGPAEGSAGSSGRRWHRRALGHGTPSAMVVHHQGGQSRPRPASRRR